MNEELQREAEKLRKDVNVGALYKFLVILAVVCALSLAAMWGIFVYFNNAFNEEDPKLSPLAVPAGESPPQPRLQINEPEDLHAIRLEEQQALKSYGWVDKQKGIVHIPIDKAIEIVASDKDLQTPAPSAQTQTVPSQSETQQP